AFAVASRAEAWIETINYRILSCCFRGRLPRGGVDRNSQCCNSVDVGHRRLPRGGVDRNCRAGACGHARQSVASRAEAWIETPLFTYQKCNISVASRAEAWIET